MIPEKLKAEALSLLSMGRTPEEVSEQFELPLMLVREWKSKLTGSDLVRLSANTHAMKTIMEGEVVTKKVSTQQIQDLLEETAYNIAEEANDVIKYPDLVKAKTLHMMADTVSKLYQTIINKNQTQDSKAPANPAMELLAQLGKD